MEARDAQTLKHIRALFVLRPEFRVPTQLDKVQTELELFPMDYALEAKARDKQDWIKETRKLFQTCSYDDKANKMLYVNEWVSPHITHLRICNKATGGACTVDLQQMGRCEDEQ